MQCWMKFVPVKKGRISIDTWRSFLQLPLLSKIEMRVHLEAELSRAQSASSGAPSVRKFRYYTHPRKYGYDVSVLCPFVHSLGMREGDQVSARRGEEYVIFSFREIVRCICTTHVFSWREIPINLRVSRDDGLAAAFAVCSSLWKGRKGFQRFYIYGKDFGH